MKVSQSLFHNAHPNPNPNENVLKRAWDQHAARTYKLIKLHYLRMQKKKILALAMKMGMENESKTKVCIITRSRNPIIMRFFLLLDAFLSFILRQCCAVWVCRHSRNERINVSMWMFVFIMHISRSCSLEPQSKKLFIFFPLNDKFFFSSACLCYSVDVCRKSTDKIPIGFFKLTFIKLFG